MDEVMCDSDEYWAAMEEATGTIVPWATLDARHQLESEATRCARHNYGSIGMGTHRAVNAGAAVVGDAETVAESRYAGLADHLSTRGWFEMERLRPTGSTE